MFCQNPSAGIVFCPIILKDALSPSKILELISKQDRPDVWQTF